MFEIQHCSCFITGVEQNSTTVSYKLSQQLSAGQRLEVNIPLIETYWTTDENSLIDQIQFQSKCNSFNSRMALRLLKKEFCDGMVLNATIECSAM